MRRDPINALFFALCVLAVTAVATGCAAPVAEHRAAPAQTGSPRVDVGTLTRGGTSGFGTEELFAYIDPADRAQYYNVFRMGNNRLISVCLRARQERGIFSHDQLGVYDLTNESDINGRRHDIGKPASSSLDYFRYSLRFVPQGRDTLVVVTDSGGRSATLSINKMYKLRVMGPSDPVWTGSIKYTVVGESSDYGYLLWFTEDAVRAASDTHAAPSNLIPKYVVPTNVKKGVIVQKLGDEIPLGDTGYVLRFENGIWVPRKAE
jgi:hypothetical protein